MLNLKENGCIPSRYIFAVMAFLGMFNVYTLRVNVSVAIVAMVNQSAVNQPVSNISGFGGTTCPAANSSKKVENTDYNGEFNWDGSTRGLILGSFFYGYIFTCFLGGWFSHRFGAKYVFGGSVFIGGILVLLTPLAARYHYGALIAVRSLQGLVNGVCFPAMQNLLSHWCLPMERTKMIGFVYSGMHFGTVICLAASGFLIRTWGWESIFYLFGSLSCVWFIGWVIFVHDSPHTHPRISSLELARFAEYFPDKIPGAKLKRFPWRRAMRSIPFLAIVVAHFGSSWGFFTLLTNLPTYLNNVLHFDIEQNGLLSALPYLTVGIFTQIFGFIADWLLKHHLSTTQVRRLFQCTDLLVPAACLIGVGFTCNPYIAVTLFVISVACSGANFSGIFANVIDLSPQYAGLLLGLSMTFGMSAGILAPYVVGLITSGPFGQTMENWRTVFYITAALSSFSAVFFAVFSSGELQDWDSNPLKNNPKHYELQLDTIK